MTECSWCDHDPACGVASYSDAEFVYDLCHDDDHSCYEELQRAKVRVRETLKKYGYLLEYG